MKVGQKKIGEGCMGNFGFGGRNDRDKRLVQYAQYQNMSIINTFFKKYLNRKWTWEAPNETARNEVNFILTTVTTEYSERELSLI